MLRSDKSKWSGCSACDDYKLIIISSFSRGQILIRINTVQQKVKKMYCTAPQSGWSVQTESGWFDGPPALLIAGPWRDLSVADDVQLQD